MVFSNITFGHFSCLSIWGDVFFLVDVEKSTLNRKRGVDFSGKGTLVRLLRKENAYEMV